MPMSPLNAVVTSRERLTLNAASPARKAREIIASHRRPALRCMWDGVCFWDLLHGLNLRTFHHDYQYASVALGECAGGRKGSFARDGFGGRGEVMEVIHSLHALGYAEVGDWSRIVPIPDEGAFMSILTRHRSRD
jgi:hypothetical protein